MGVEAATCSRIEDVDAVVGGKGDAAGCWCQWDRMSNTEYEQISPEVKRERLAAELTENGHGVVAKVDGRPAAWCRVGPRSGFPRVTRSTVMKTSDLSDDEVWSITCFVVNPEFRGQGLIAALLDAAVLRAAEGGARWVEGYPIDTSDGARRRVSELYRGTLSVFLAAGFSEVARPKPSRVVVRLAV